jgi:hypothetical protein
MELKTHCKFGGDAFTTVLNNPRQNNWVVVVRHVRFGVRQQGSFLAMAKTKLKFPVERAAALSMMAWTSGHDLSAKSVPNLGQMWGKLVMMGAGRSSLFAVAVESTDTSATKKREFGVRGLGVLSLDLRLE